MKIKNLLFLILPFLFSCETDFDVNANWKDVTIVYGLIDPNNEDQLIKINKAYLGQGDAIQMASIGLHPHSIACRTTLFICPSCTMVPE